MNARIRFDKAMLDADEVVKNARPSATYLHSNPAERGVEDTLATKFEYLGLPVLAVLQEVRTTGVREMRWLIPGFIGAEGFRGIRSPSGQVETPIEMLVDDAEAREYLKTCVLGICEAPVEFW